MLPNTMNPMGLNRKPANDCLPDGTFDTTPRAIIRGGACLIDGTEMFADSIELEKVTGNFSNLTVGEAMFKWCKSIKIVDAQFPKIDNMAEMFQDCAMSSFTSDVSTVKSMFWCFSYNRKLTRFSSPLPNLVNASNCFNQCGLLSWDIPLPNLVFGDGMFDGCDFTTIDLQLPKCTTTSKCHINSAYLKTAIYDLPAAAIIDRMFYNCAVLTDVTMSCPLATNAHYMFYHCPKLVAVPDFPNLSNGEAMFDGCSSLGDNTITNIIASLPTYTTEEHNIGFKDVPALTQAHIDAAAAKGWTVQGTPQGDCLADGTFDTTPRAIVTGGPCLINGSNLFASSRTAVEVVGIFKNMTNAEKMFYNCSKLRSFTAELPALTSAEKMFYYSTMLTSFTADLPALINGKSMFHNTSFPSYSGLLSSLTNGDDMFASKNGFTSFTSELPSLVSGHEMFRLARITGDNITSIIASLPTYSSGVHNIGFQHVLALTQSHVAAAAAKGWTVQGTPQA